jgi:hypothetical protein
LAAESSLNAAYSAIAISAQQIADTEHFSNQEHAIATNLIGAERISEVYERVISSINHIDYKNDKSLTEEQKIERDQAIREVYGADSKIEDYTNE